MEYMDKMGMDMSGQFQQAMSFFINPPVQVTLQGGGVHMLNENANDWLDIVTSFASTIEAGKVQSPYYDQQIQDGTQ